MSLPAILASSREHVLSMGIHQIVPMAGDGKLREQSDDVLWYLSHAGKLLSLAPFRFEIA
jgi:hypothetical protein